MACPFKCKASNLFHFIFVLLFSGTLVSCVSTGPEIFGANFFDGDIKTGMTMDEVQAYLGPPNRSDKVSESKKGKQVWTYLFQAPTSEGKFIFKELTLVFHDDTVAMTNYRERFLLKPEREVRLSNRVIEIR